MNLTTLAADLASRIPDMAKDTPLNNSEVIERLIVNHLTVLIDEVIGRYCAKAVEKPAGYTATEQDLLPIKIFLANKHATNEKPMNKPFDITKPVQCRNGEKVEIFCKNARGNYPIFGRRIGKQIDHVEKWTPNGKWSVCFDYESEYDLVNIPEEPVKRVIYLPMFSFISSVCECSEEAAKARWPSSTIARIEWEEPQPSGPESKKCKMCGNAAWLVGGLCHECSAIDEGVKRRVAKGATGPIPKVEPGVKPDPSLCCDCGSKLLWHETHSGNEVGHCPACGSSGYRRPAKRTTVDCDKVFPEKAKEPACSVCGGPVSWGNTMGTCQNCQQINHRQVPKEGPVCQKCGGEVLWRRGVDSTGMAHGHCLSCGAQAHKQVLK